jgi:hypothetical protein
LSISFLLIFYIYNLPRPLPPAAAAAATAAHNARSSGNNNSDGGYHDDEDRSVATASQYLSSDEEAFAPTEFGDDDQNELSRRLSANHGDNPGDHDDNDDIIDVDVRPLSRLSVAARRSASELAHGSRTVGRPRSDSTLAGPPAATASDVSASSSTTRPGHRRRSSAAAPGAARPPWSVRTPPRTRSPSPVTVTPTHDNTTGKRLSDGEDHSAMSRSGSVVHVVTAPINYYSTNTGDGLNSGNGNTAKGSNGKGNNSGSVAIPAAAPPPPPVAELLLATLLRGPPSVDDEGRPIASCLVYRCLSEWKAFAALPAAGSSSLLSSPAAAAASASAATPAATSAASASAASASAAAAASAASSPETELAGNRCLSQALFAYDALLRFSAGTLTPMLMALCELTAMVTLLRHEVTRLKGGLAIATPAGRRGGGGRESRLHYAISHAHSAIRAFEHALDDRRVRLFRDIV